MADLEQRQEESRREPDDKFHQEREEEEVTRSEQSAGLQEELAPRDDNDSG